MRLRIVATLAAITLFVPAVAVYAVPPSPELLERMAEDPELAAHIEEVTKDARLRGLDEPAERKLVVTKDRFGAPQVMVAPAGVTTGSNLTLVLLVDFADEEAQVDATDFDELFFKDVYGPESLRGYYREVSYGTPTDVGLLDLWTHNSPSIIGWVRLPETLEFYAGDGYGWGVYPNNAKRLVEDAVALVDHAVDFSLYDNDGNGFVDNLIIVHAGRDAAVTGLRTDIWSHAWTTSAPLDVDGVKVWRYSMNAEYIFEPGDMTVGTPAHEFGHTLGLPDLYDLDVFDTPESASVGVGRWSLMGHGNWNRAPSNATQGSSPARLDAWSSLQLGWTQPQVVVGSPQSRSIPTAGTQRFTDTWKLYPGGLSSGPEYFLVENRQRTGTDAGLPGAGLLVWHVDETQSSNDDPERKLVDLEEAHGGLQSLDVTKAEDDARDPEDRVRNYGDEGDPFPGITGNLAFTDFTDPDARLYSGLISGISTVSHVIVDEISNSGSTMTARMGYNVDRMSINDGAEYTNEWTVRLDAFISRAAEMRIDAGSGFGGWLVYKEHHPVMLPVGDGNKPVTVEYKDEYGNPLVTIFSMIKLDTAAPVITSLMSPSHPTSDDWYSGVPQFDWVAFDAVGIAGYSYSVDTTSNTIPDTVSTGTSASVTYPDLADGKYYFHVRAGDGAANWGVPEHYGFWLDRTPPRSASIVPGRYVDSVVVSISAVDEHAGVEASYYSLDGGPWTKYVAPFRVEATGLHTLSYYSVDVVGNMEQPRSVNFNVIIDTFPQLSVAGSNRFATAVEASKLGFPDGSEVVLVSTGRNWPDALGAAALAGVLDAPILLTERSGVPPVVADEIKRLGAKQVIVIGGTAAVDTSAEVALRGIGSILNVTRIAGTDRYDTALKVAREVERIQGASYDGTVLVATGAQYADALAASPVSAANGWPILLAKPGVGLSAGAVTFADNQYTKKPGARAIILGGRSAVGYETYEDLFGVFGGHNRLGRISGKDRYETAALIARWSSVAGGMNWEAPALATGTSPYDALAGGPAQARAGSVLLLTKPDELSGAAASCFHEFVSEMFQVRFLGGTGALSQDVRDEVATFFE